MNPYARQIHLSSPSSTAIFAARLKERVRPLAIKESFESSLHPRGVVMGWVGASRFEISEAMYGFGGATAAGDIASAAQGTEVRCRLRPSGFIRFGFTVLSGVFTLVCYLYGQTLWANGFSLGQFVAFVVYTSVYAGVWGIALSEMKGLERFLVSVLDAAEEENEP